MTSTKYETTIEADPNLPTVRMVRDFDATPDRVFKAFADPELFARWVGPDGVGIEVHRWDARTGGNYRYSAGSGEQVASFYGSFHELRPGERIVQTQTYEDIPDGVALETITFEDLGGGRTRVTSLSVLETMEGRDGMVASGMEVGVIQGYEQLDALLAEGVV